MGLRCLLGHDFGEPETERQRNEEGNEVVVTVREVKTCQTCGETRVVSENKEIKSIEQLRRSAVGDDAYGSAGQSGGNDAYDSGVGQTGSATAETNESSPPDMPTGPTNTPNDGTGPIGSTDEDDGGIAGAIQDAETGTSESDTPTDEGVVIDDEGDRTPDEADPAPTYSGAESASDAPEQGDVDPASDADPDPDADEPAAEPTEEDAVILDGEEDAPSEAERKQWEETADPEEIPGNETPDPEPDGDDAVIMDADAVEPEPETTEEGYTPWPDQHAEDEGHDAGIPDEEPAGVDFEGNLTPTADSEEPTADEDAEVSRSSADDVADVARTTTDASRNGAPKRERRPAPEPNVDLERAASDVNLEYHCPDCGLTRSVGNSSMRAGDICPECHRGYITERPRQS